MKTKDYNSWPKDNLYVEWSRATASKEDKSNILCSEAYFLTTSEIQTVGK